MITVWAKNSTYCFISAGDEEIPTGRMHNMSWTVLMDMFWNLLWALCLDFWYFPVDSPVFLRFVLLPIFVAHFSHCWWQASATPSHVPPVYNHNHVSSLCAHTVCCMGVVCQGNKKSNTTQSQLEKVGLKTDFAYSLTIKVYQLYDIYTGPQLIYTKVYAPVKGV